MRKSTLAAGAVLIAVASFALGAETRKSMVKSYATLADTILGAKRTEEHIVRAILDDHARGAQAAFDAGKWEDAAAEMALFANEGDNQIGGIRKRLLEGGHHHNAEGEAKGIFEEGFVVVTKDQKTKALAASADLLHATDDAGRKAAWAAFAAVSEPIQKAQ
ncbi:MAG: hypothetical protein K8T90_21825 [Planctomycetes bacterium]|nr:hypothetical protein [Planctomycetota bacterium]